jgi:tyrosinase
MDRSRTTLLAVSLALLVPAPAALAQDTAPPSLDNPTAPANSGAPKDEHLEKKGEGNNDVVNGTQGGPGNDIIIDTQHGGHVEGGPGDDHIDVRNDRPGDTVTCGAGHDFVISDPGDHVAADCEVVTTRAPALVRKDAKDLTAAERHDFVQAILKLKDTVSPYNAKLNWYDQFVAWHDEAFAGAAHGGPSFLPWHRQFLLMFEDALSTVSGKEIALPYWDWTDPASTRAVFSDSLMGPDGDPSAGNVVTKGPFRQGAWRLYVRDPASTQPLEPEAGELPREGPSIVRGFGAFAGVNLPTTEDVNDLLGITPYDSSPFSQRSPATASFRNALEGWQQLRQGIGSHNSVHVWVGGAGGTMALTTSPNDPVFWLHHNNVDRLWDLWQRRNGFSYVPASGARKGDNLNDEMEPFKSVGIAVTPRHLLHTEALDYRYAGATATRAATTPQPPSLQAAAARAGLVCVQHAAAPL